MKNKITLWLSGAALLCASAAYATPGTDATLFIWDSAGDTAVTVNDNIGVDNQALPGVVGWNGTIGSWNLNADVGTSKPEQGGATFPSMDLSFLAKSSAAGTINIAFFDDGFGPVNGTAMMSIGGTASGTVTYTTYTRGGTAAPAFGTTSYTPTADGWSKLASSGGLTGAFADNFSGGLASGGQNPFELLQVISITVGSAGLPVTTGDATLTAPDGGMTLMLLGSSLTALAFIRRSFKKA